MDVQRIISALGGPANIAAHTGIPANTVAYWKQRRSIPATRWLALTAMQGAAEMGVTVEALAAAHADPADARPATPRRVIITGSDSPAPRPGMMRRGLAETQAPFAAEAQALGLDAAAIAAKAVQEAILSEKARRWLEANREAIAAHTRWVEEHGLPLAEYRMF